MNNVTKFWVHHVVMYIIVTIFMMLLYYLLYVVLKDGKYIINEWLMCFLCSQPIAITGTSANILGQWSNRHNW